MHSVTGPGYAERFSEDEAPVFVFLCDGYQTTPLKWLIENWDAIHTNAGPRWHMVVPFKVEIYGDSKLATVDNYNIDLARDLAESYGLSKFGDPVLILDNFDDDRKQLVIKIPKTEIGVRSLMQDISDVSRKFSGNETRAQMTDRMYDELRSRNLVRNLVSVAPKAASGLFGLISKAA